MNQHPLRSFLLVSVFLTFVVIPPSLCQQNRSGARQELESGLLMYNYGNYSEARQHFELALKLRPLDKTIPLWIARAIDRQYQRGVNTSENWATGMEAVAAYERALIPSNVSEALQASLQLLADMGDEELADQWRLRIARAFNVPPMERSTAYANMAARMLECARTIEVAVPPDQQKTLAEFGAVALCISNGLDYSERALSLDPGNTSALDYQHILQLEKQKQERMIAARDLSKAGAAPVKWQRADGEIPAQSATAPLERVADLRQIAFEKGVNIKGMAIRKPAPVYPAEARDAGAVGVVTVQVEIDEAGKVFSAWAITGHYLLRRAAVTAAQDAEFSPVYYNGQTVKFNHTITYYFVLKENR